MIKRRGPVYWLDFWIGKKRIRRSLKTNEYAQAIDRAQEITANLKQEKRAGDMAFAELSEKYIEWAWSTKPKSAGREEQRLKKIKAFLAGHGVHFLSGVTPYIIEQFRGELVVTGLSRATVNRYSQILRGMFYRAIDWGFFQGSNPVKKIKFYREDTPVRLLSRTEVLSVIEASRAIAKNGRSTLQRIFPDLVEFAAVTGFRKAEILQLRWRDIKDDTALIKGKGDRLRKIPLNNSAKAIIARQPRRSEFVFHVPNRDQQDLFRRTVIQIKKRTGLDFHFHLLRHFYASELLRSGVDIVTVSHLLGHSRTMTSLLYTHTDPEAMRRAVSQLDSFKT